MKVKATGRKVNLKQTFIDMVTKRLQKFDRFFEDEADATVTVTVEKGRQTVEVTVRSRGFLYRAERTAPDMETAFADAVDLITRQIVKNKEKLGNRVKAREVEMVSAELQYEPEEEDDGGDYRIVREKRFLVEPMTEQEAILQMELLGHSFFLFKNSETDEMNVVYRRNDGAYGLLIPIE